MKTFEDFNGGVPSIQGAYEVSTRPGDNWGDTKIYSFWNGKFWGYTNTLENVYAYRDIPTSLQDRKWKLVSPTLITVV